MTKNNSPQSQDKYLVPAVEQAARLLFCLAQSEGTHMGLTELGAKLGLHPSRVFSLLHTLCKHDLAQRNVGGKGYSLGLGLIELYRKVLDDLHIPRIAAPILEELALATNSTAILGLIVDDDEIIVVGKREGGKDLGVTVKIGRRFPITHSAEGKAIAAFLPAKELKKLLQKKNLYFYSDPKYFDKERLTAELAECRRLGYALDLEDVKKHGPNVVASPVIGRHGLPIGSISVLSLFAADRAPEFGKLVSEAAKTLSRQIGAKVSW